MYFSVKFVCETARGHTIRSHIRLISLRPHSHKPMRWVKRTRVRTLCMCLLLDSASAAATAFGVCVFFSCDSYSWMIVLFRILVCRRPIKAFFSQFDSFRALGYCWLFAVCIESALTLSLERTHTHGNGEARTHGSTRSFDASARNELLNALCDTAFYGPFI